MPKNKQSPIGRIFAQSGHPGEGAHSWAPCYRSRAEKTNYPTFIFCPNFPESIITCVNSGDETWQTRNFILHQGVDVIITIFSDFRQFLGEKIGVFLKKQCYDQNFALFSSVLSQKRRFFPLNFSAKIFKKS
jgi:hypothetical protein